MADTKADATRPSIVRERAGWDVTQVSHLFAPVTMMMGRGADIMSAAFDNEWKVEGERRDRAAWEVGRGESLCRQGLTPAQVT